ncbi:hypothetical protein [Streptomyces sp. NPDC007346]|uniref:hypothetical protein n=1 Tax=Streptomyces sp. NPDC007346 TaxID=3154682 RepID=UPI003455A139
MTATQAGNSGPERGRSDKERSDRGRWARRRSDRKRLSSGRSDGALCTRRIKGAGLVLAGAALFAAGLFIVTVGTSLSGLLGMRVETFGRIDCHDTRTKKGQTVWHCFGESPAQQRANEAERERVAAGALRVHVDGMPEPARTGRTRILFADHDGRNDPATITATQVSDGGRWYAHSSSVVGYGLIPLLLGTGTAAWGGFVMRQRSPSPANAGGGQGGTARSTALPLRATDQYSPGSAGRQGRR